MYVMIRIMFNFELRKDILLVQGAGGNNEK